MISSEEALALAERSFPDGPETLADRIGCVVHHTPLTGCEGWCLRLGSRMLIRINSLSSQTRQRFTLAHELAHLVLGTRPDIAQEPFRSTTADERAADQFASKLLIPESRARGYLADALPVDAKALARLARAAKVSPIMAACRIVNLTDVLGLQNAAVVFFDSRGDYQWRYTSGLRFAESDAVALHQQALNSKHPVRVPNSNDMIVVGSAIRADSYSALLIQLLTPSVAAQPTIEERLMQLRQTVFAGDHSSQQSVAACLGYIRHTYSDKTVTEALQEFDKRYLPQKWTPDLRRRLLQPEGREYLRIELGKSCKPD